MATETQVQIIREDPRIEDYRLGLLRGVSQFVADNLNYMPPVPYTPPGYQVAGLTPLQQEAAVMARRGIGGYQPYMQAGLDTLRRGEAYTEDYGFGGLQEALGATREGQKVLSQAAQIAAQQRAQPYAYQEAASRGLARAADMSREAAQFGYGALGGTGRQYDPANVGLYMNPFEDQVVQQAMADIDRGSQLQRQQLGAQAAATGAFGGSRQAVAEQEMNRNLAEQKARTASQLRMAGYGQASQQAQQAFEEAQRRRQQAAQLYGNIGQQAAGTALTASQAGGQLGLQYGQLGQADVNQLINLGQTSAQIGQGVGSLAQTGGQLGAQLCQMGLQQAGLGQLGQQLNLGDVKTIEALGARDQALQQAVLDAQRQSNLQLYQLPFQQYSFLSDIYKGTPSSQQVTQMTQTQDPSTFQQIAGLGIAGLSAAAGAKNLGLGFGF